MPEINFNAQVIKLADRINKKRRQELINIYDSTSVFKALEYIRSQQIYDKGNKSKTMRKIASMPIEVDQFFEKIYGKDYYKDKDFFTNIAPEWTTIDPKKIYSKN